jgi:hypothetical protein
MYHGKNFLLPLNRAQLAEGGWCTTVLYLWTRGVLPPRFDRRVLGLHDGVGSLGLRFCPTVIHYDRDLALVVRAGRDGGGPGGGLARPFFEPLSTLEEVLYVETGEGILPPHGL